MALATRCPHCETVFKLDPHLIAPHDGRVRCGHCQEVFDAAHHRFELPDDGAASGLAQHAALIDDDAAVGPSSHSAPASALDAPARAATPEPPLKPKPFAPRTLDLGATGPARRADVPPAPPAPPAPPVGASREEANDPTVYADPPAFTNAPAEKRAAPAHDEPAPPAQGAAANEWSALPPEPPRMKQFVRAGSPSPDGASPTHARAQTHAPVEPSTPPFIPPMGDRAEPFIGPAHESVEPPPAARPAPPPASAWREDEEPGFGAKAPAGAHPASANEAFPVTREPRESREPREARETRAPARPKKGRRIAGVIVAILLALLLIAQLAWWQRETVMVNLPGSHALYSEVCDALGCTVSPPRDIDGLQIESSGLRQVDGPHKLELKLSLRNRLDVALAYPALELTLLDDKNNVAIRRVLWPQDYARPGTIFAIGLPPQSAQPVIVRLDTGDAVAANYRVQVFYP